MKGIQMNVRKCLLIENEVQETRQLLGCFSHALYGKGPRFPEHPLCLRVNHIDVTTHKLEISKMYLEQWKRLGLRHFI